MEHFEELELKPLPVPGTPEGNGIFNFPGQQSNHILNALRLYVLPSFLNGMYLSFLMVLRDARDVCDMCESPRGE